MCSSDLMEFYRAILKFYRRFLKPDGFFLFEIGYDQKESITALAAGHGYRAEVTCDLGGNPRCALLWKAD